jgi:hypothetical protein
MAERPAIKPGDWISIGKVEAVVAGIDADGGCEVVFNRDKPTNLPARWSCLGVC